MHRQIMALACIVGLPLTAVAQEDHFHATAAEKAACTAVATRLCAYTWPDEDKLIACMKANEAKLGPTCLPIFKAGIRWRGL